jgi:hypothetical protein
VLPDRREPAHDPAVGRQLRSQRSRAPNVPAVPLVCEVEAPQVELVVLLEVGQQLVGALPLRTGEDG